MPQPKVCFVEIDLLNTLAVDRRLTPTALRLYLALSATSFMSSKAQDYCCLYRLTQIVGSMGLAKTESREDAMNALEPHLRSLETLGLVSPRLNELQLYAVLGRLNQTERSRADSVAGHGLPIVRLLNVGGTGHKHSGYSRTLGSKMILLQQSFVRSSMGQLSDDELILLLFLFSGVRFPIFGGVHQGMVSKKENGTIVIDPTCRELFKRACGVTVKGVPSPDPLTVLGSLIDKGLFGWIQLPMMRVKQYANKWVIKPPWQAPPKTLSEDELDEHRNVLVPLSGFCLRGNDEDLLLMIGMNMFGDVDQEMVDLLSAQVVTKRRSLNQMT